MLPRIATSARLLSRISRTNVPERSMGGHGPSKSLLELSRENRVTLNDLPVPSGSWQEAYNAKNSKWNMQLAVSAVLMVVTIGAMQAGGVFLFHDTPDYKKIEVDAYQKAEE